LPNTLIISKFTVKPTKLICEKHQRKSSSGTTLEGRKVRKKDGWREGRIEERKEEALFHSR